MQFTAVVGLITATIRIDPLKGIRFCVLQDVSKDGNAAMAWTSVVKPVDAVVDGIVDYEKG